MGMLSMEGSSVASEMDGTSEATFNCVSQPALPAFSSLATESGLTLPCCCGGISEPGLIALALASFSCNKAAASTPERNRNLQKLFQNGMGAVK